MIVHIVMPMYDLDVDSLRSFVPLHFSPKAYNVLQKSLSLTVVERKLNVIVLSLGSGTERQKIGRARALAAGVKKQTVEQAKSQITGAVVRASESFLHTLVILCQDICANILFDKNIQEHIKYIIY